eukprot:CAMPEP_0172814094 /NCGR_PEP_ID=MMETSP1075-20121228/11053_1 /TAXON_ID=2916 /ORGANISM="Ceratium fusus, Strain PA161109" /LENGTH=389 /DNA_ID=CAMNT_0013653877 /DNA_START=41 /DNA_END=1210 /DNA_ORIENTATION=+
MADFATALRELQHQPDQPKADFASTLRELQHQPHHWNTEGCAQKQPKLRQMGDMPKIAPCLNRSPRGVAFSWQQKQQQQQPPKHGSSCMARPSPVSEREAQHSHISCTGSALMEADVDRSSFCNKEPIPKLGGSCTVPTPARRVVQHTRLDRTRLALLQVDQDAGSVQHRGSSPQLGGSCSVPVPAKQDIKHDKVNRTRSALLQADADGSPLRWRTTLQQRVGPQAFSASVPRTWPLLKGAHPPNFERCGGQPTTNHMHGRSVSDGLSMPRLLLTPSSLMSVATTNGSAARILAEDSSSTMDPCSSIDSDAFSEFLEGDPWEKCKELAAEGLAEWYRDFISHRLGQQKEEAEVPLSQEQGFSSIDQPANVLPHSTPHKKLLQRMVSAAW